MLELRPAIVVETDGGEEAAAADGALGRQGRAGEQRLVVALLDALESDGPTPAQASGGPDGAPGLRRAAICDTRLLGRAARGDRVIVNTAALDMGLGSGGFDVVHVNLTRGLRAPGPDGAGHVAASAAADVAGPRAMKLNYTSLQHVVAPVEEGELELPLSRPVAVLALHGQLAAVAWAFAQANPGARLGYVQTGGGALPGGHSRTVGALRDSGLLAGHLTAGAAFGGEHEAMTTAGALHHGIASLGWDAAVCGPGPGIVGCATALGHGGMAALDSAHVALALGCPTLLVARLSGVDARARHRPISHHTLTVLDLLLAPVTVALPAGLRSPVGAELRAGLADVFAQGEGAPAVPAGAEVPRPVRITRHDWRRATVDLPGFAGSGLAEPAMGRGPLQDPLFFAAALAGGSALAELVQAREADRAGAPADLERV